ncbi:hypothetical protein TIFTF001_011897 [Ficus carica]|nr:hypothetical protein TIFTF001_011897 [Ficus carica]
MHKIILL